MLVEEICSCKEIPQEKLLVPNSMVRAIDFMLLFVGCHMMFSTHYITTMTLLLDLISLGEVKVEVERRSVNYEGSFADCFLGHFMCTCPRCFLC